MNDTILVLALTKLLLQFVLNYCVKIPKELSDILDFYYLMLVTKNLDSRKTIKICTEKLKTACLRRFSW